MSLSPISSYENKLDVELINNPHNKKPKVSLRLEGQANDCLGEIHISSHLNGEFLFHNYKYFITDCKIPKAGENKNACILNELNRQNIALHLHITIN